MSKAPFFRTPYNYDTKAASLESATSFEGEVSLTVQEHSEDADINVIVRRFGLTGVMPPNHRVPQYGDFTGISDYRSALAAVDEAYAHFMEMPHEIRSKFDNDPQAFMDFCSVKGNLPQLKEWGLAIPDKVEDTTLRDVVDAVNKLVPRETGSNDGKQGGSSGK